MSQDARTDTAALVARLAEGEVLAEEVAMDRGQIVAYDRRRNTNREALGELTRKRLKHKDKVWMNMGAVFMKLPRTEVVRLLSAEQDELSAEITQLRDGLKPKVAKMKEMDGEELNPGWDLKGMGSKELAGSKLNQIT